MDVKDKPRLCPLGELKDFRVAEGNPDIRGWEVYGADSLRLGEVRELVVDTQALKARYMVIALDRTLPGVAGDRTVLVPLGRARLDDALDRVYLENVTAQTANTLPAYDAGSLTPERERALFGGGQPDVYAHADFDANRFFGQRRQAPDEAYVIRETVIIGGADVKREQFEPAPGEKKKEPV